MIPEFDYSKTILIMKPVGPDSAASLQSENKTNRLISFHSEDGRKKSSDAVPSAKMIHDGNLKEVEILKGVSYVSDD